MRRTTESLQFAQNVGQVFKTEKVPVVGSPVDLFVQPEVAGESRVGEIDHADVDAVRPAVVIRLADGNVQRLSLIHI